MFGKKKVSIDFKEPEYALLATRAKDEGKSNSALVNSLISLFYRVSPDVAKKIGSFCREQYMQETALLETLSGFERDEAQKRANQYKNLASYFGYDTTADTDTGMAITFLKEGYVIYPKDWIVLEDVFGPADSCMYAGVVECRNADRYGIPHFLYFCDEQYSKDYSDDMQARIYAACAKAYPAFKEYYNMQLPAPNQGDLEALEKWNTSPSFGLFHLVVKGDPFYWHEYDPEYKPPYGAMIVRESHTPDQGTEKTV